MPSFDVKGSFEWALLALPLNKKYLFNFSCERKVFTGGFGLKVVGFLVSTDVEDVDAVLP